MLDTQQSGDFRDAERTLRDVVALSTLPAIWLGADPLRIVESLAAALYTIVGADFVYVCLQGDADHDPIAIAQTGRTETDPALAAEAGPRLLDWTRGHDPDDVMLLPHASGGTLRVTARGLAVDAEYGLIAVGFLNETAPLPVHQLLVNVAATQATTAIENVRLLRSLRRYAGQLRGLTDATSAMLDPAHSVEDALQVITDRAREVIGAHRAVTTLVMPPHADRTIETVSVSSEWSAAEGAQRQPDGELTAPFIGADGAELGVIQLSGKNHGTFAERDTAILLQLTRMAALIIEQRGAAAAERLAIQEAEVARAEAEAASGAKDEFLAMLGHELRNPLAPIQTALQLMRLRGDAGAEHERTVIERQVRHLTRLVDDLLDVSRIAQGKVALKRERLNVAEVVAKGIEMASPLIEQRRHTLDVHVPRTGLHVDGDSLRLAQVVSNLLTNAAKYMEPGGVITLRATASEASVILSVRDTGIGIDPTMLPRIFDLFVQGRQSIARSEGGLGLGLTIVRNLMAMHGGTVSVRSDGVGRGTEVLITLPIAPAEETALATGARGAAGTAAVPSKAVRVLVVDDNDDAANMLVELLTYEGFDVRTAHDGPSAIRVCSEFKPAIALLDIGLPVMDGYELAARLRELPGVGPLHLVAVTGYGQETDRQRSTAAGFHEHLVKPIDLDVLVQVLQTARVSRPNVGTALL
jgi:signal transduction histidine kinase/ActR/RegA family two-component response regulator